MSKTPKEYNLKTIQDICDCVDKDNVEQFIIDLGIMLREVAVTKEMKIEGKEFVGIEMESLIWIDDGKDTVTVEKIICSSEEFDISKEFNYCIARECSKIGRISIYTYGREVHYGSIKSAKKMLEYVNSQHDPNETGWEDYGEYRIFIVNKSI